VKFHRFAVVQRPELLWNLRIFLPAHAVQLQCFSGRNYVAVQSARMIAVRVGNPGVLACVLGIQPKIDFREMNALGSEINLHAQHLPW
jgi:hypothetical protein